MEQSIHYEELLEQMLMPVFLVKDHRIIRVNASAARLLIQEGNCIDTLLAAGLEEYAQYTRGCLYVTLRVFGTFWGASVTRTEAGDLFTLDQQSEDPALQCLALAARDLRTPLSAAMTAAGKFALCAETPEQEAASASLNRSLMQLLRQVGNYSDCSNALLPYMEMTDLNALFAEAAQKAAALAERKGVAVSWMGLHASAEGMADRQQLERAMLNLVSNSIKFGATEIRIHLTRQRNLLLLRISDNGSGIPQPIQASLFRRYQRMPMLEERSQGAGLGMVIVRSTASAHGGTVLVDHPEETGTRITLTLPLRTQVEQKLCSPLFLDYAGMWDHSLVELSDVLPDDCYQKL